MIVQLWGASAGEVDRAGTILSDLTLSWDQTAGISSTTSLTTPDGTRAVDPIALSALILSIPSSALAVVDLADRIIKRRRAHELIAQARQLAQRQITIEILADGRPTALHTLEPDELLALAADDDTPSPDGASPAST